MQLKYYVSGSSGNVSSPNLQFLDVVFFLSELLYKPKEDPPSKKLCLNEEHCLRLHSVRLS